MTTDLTSDIFAEQLADIFPGQQRTFFAPVLLF